MVLWDKPLGPSSHQALGIIKRTFGTRRVGHAGTLDPDATGLLVCAVGKATRLLQEVEAREKEYVFALRLGVVTTTLDMAGEVVETRAVPDLSGFDWAPLLERFTGVLQQVPPAVSALKVDGVRAYDRVRNGEVLDLPAREVTVLRFEQIVDLTDPVLPGGDPLFRVACSKGTYVRSLARDLGDALGCGASVSFLRRTAIGPWRVPDLPTSEAAEPMLRPVGDFFAHWPRFEATEADRDALRVGKCIECPLPDTGLALAMGSDALASGHVAGGSFHPDILLIDAQ